MNDESQKYEPLVLTSESWAVIDLHFLCMAKGLLLVTYYMSY